MSGMTPDQQSQFDKLEAKIKPVANGYLVKCGPWYVAKDINEALLRVRDYLDRLAREGRRASP